jgi:hypothetical protein
MTSVQSQYMFCPPLAFKTAWTQQQPKSLHSGTSPEKPDRDSKRNSIKCPRSPTNMDTVRNLLRENGLRVRRPYFGAVLRPRHRFARVRSCNRVRGWDLQNWRRVWFSDESKFILQKRDGRTRVYKRRNKRIARKCDDAISYARKSQLVRILGNLNAARYRYEVLTPHMLPAMNLRREVFQHDNTGSHTARATVDFLVNQNVRVLPGRLNHQIWTQ